MIMPVSIVQMILVTVFFFIQIYIYSDINNYGLLQIHKFNHK